MAEEIAGGGYNAGAVYVDIVANDKPLWETVEALGQKAKGLNRGAISIPVDHRSLHELNRHLDLKDEHKKRLQREWNANPLRIAVDTRALDKVSQQLGSLSADVARLAQSQVAIRATLDTTAVRSELTAIAAESRIIRYTATVDLPDIAALEAQIQGQINAVVDPSRLKSAAPDIGKAIANEVGKAKVSIDQGGFVSRVLLGGLGSITRGFQESIGREIFLGTSRQTRNRVRSVGGIVENVSGAVGTVVRDRALAGAGFAGTKDFEQAIKSLSLEKLFIAPITAATAQARQAAVIASSEGKNAAKAYFAEFKKVLVSEVKSSAEIKDAAIGAAGRVVAGGINVVAPVQNFRRDVAIERAKRQAATLSVDFTKEELDSIYRAKGQILVGNAGYYSFQRGNTGDVLAPSARRFLGQEFVGIDNPSATAFLRYEKLPENLKAVINEEKTLAFFRNLAKVAQRLGIEIPKELANIPDGDALEAALLKILKGQNGELQRAYLSAIESTFGSGINADLPQQIAKVQAIQKLRPDLEVKGVGFSGGGFYVDQLSRALGIKSAALGTPFFQQPATVSGRGTSDYLFNLYGKNAFLSQISGPNFQDLQRAGRSHTPEQYFGNQNVRSFLNDRLSLGLTPEQLKTQGVDPRNLKNADRSIKEAIAALVDVAEAASYLEDIQSYVGKIDFERLQDVPAVVNKVFGGIERSIEGFDKLTGDELVDDARDRLTGITDKYRQNILKLTSQPEKIMAEFNRYFEEFQGEASSALSVRPGNVPSLPNSLPKESTALANTFTSVKSEVVDTDNAFQKLKKRTLQVESQFLDLISGGKGDGLKQAVGLSAQYQLGELGRNALRGTATAARGGYGLLQGTENAVLGLAPFGLGQGAKRLTQAGLGFAAINAVAPGAGDFVLSAGSGLGSTVGTGIGEAFTGYLLSNTAGFVAPVVQAIGSGLTALLSSGGGVIGAGAAVLGAGATASNVGGKLLGAASQQLAPQPIQLALKDAKQAELVGIEIAKGVTQAAIKGAERQVKALGPAKSVFAEVSPISEALQIRGQQFTGALPPAKASQDFLSVTPRPQIGGKPSGVSGGGAIATAQQLVIASQEARSKFLQLISDPAIKNGRVDLLYNAAIEARKLIDQTQRAKNELRQLSYENKGTPDQQRITGNMGPIVRNAKEAQNTLAELSRRYQKAGSDIGVFIDAGIAAGLSPEESTAAAEKLVALIQDTINRGFEIASPSRWARRAAQFVVQGFALGMKPADAIAAANRLADGVIKATETGFGSKFKGIANQFVLGLQDEIVQAQSKFIGGRRFAVTLFSGVDNAIAFDGKTTIAEIREQAKKVGIEIEKTNTSLYQLTSKGFKARQNGSTPNTITPFAFTPFQGADNAVKFNPNTRLKLILDEAEKLGIQYDRAVKRFDVAGRGQGQTPYIKPKTFTQFQGKDDAVVFNLESRIGDVVKKAQEKGLYGQIPASNYEFTPQGFRKKRFTDLPFTTPSTPVEEQSKIPVGPSKEQAFNAGKEVGERVGAGIKSSAKTVKEAARNVGENIPEELKRGSGTGFSALKGFFEGLKSQFNGLRQELPILDKLSGGIKNIFLLAGGGFVGFQAFTLLQSQATKSYEAIKQLESARVVVKFATGSTNDLTVAENQAKRLGTNLAESRNAAKSLAIQTKNTALESQRQTIFEGASTAAASLQLNAEQSNRLFTAFNQIAGKGTVQSEELKQQLGELGISYSLAARSVGLTTSEFSKQLEQGAILSQDFLPKFARQIKVEYGGAALAAAESVQGLENATANAALRLQEGLGQQSLPLVTAGLKTLNAGLEFGADNISALTNLINVGLIAALLKGSKAFGQFAFAQQTATTKDALGNITGVAPIGSRAGRAARAGIDFVRGGGIQSALQSPLAKELGTAAVQVATISAAFSTFSTINEAFTGGDVMRDYNAQLEITKKRLDEINARGGTPQLQKFDQSKQYFENVGSALASLGRFDIGGYQKGVASAISTLSGNDTSQVFGTGPLVTLEQANNSRGLLAGLDLLKSGEFGKAFTQGGQFASQLTKKITVDPKAVQNSREALSAYRDQLNAIPEAIRNTAEGAPIKAAIVQLDSLIKKLGGTGSAYTDLTKAVLQYNDVTKNQIALQQALDQAASAKGRAEGRTTEFAAKQAEIEAQRKAGETNRANLKALVSQSDAFLASQDFTNLEKTDANKARELRQQNLEYKTQYAAADKQVDEAITQSRLEGVNRRAELLQREVAEQERGIAVLEGQRRILTTARDANQSSELVTQSITPQRARLRQFGNQQQDAQAEIAEQEQRLANARQNLRRAERGLAAINPNDEQQYEQAKATVGQYQQAVLAAESEINTQRKAYADAELGRREEILTQASQVIDLIGRKEEQSFTTRTQANDRLAAAQKRAADNQVAGAERVNRLLGKQVELMNTQIQKAQTLGSGQVGALKSAEDIARQYADLDPNKKPETEADKARRRERLGGVLDRLGFGRDEEAIFKKRVQSEDRLAEIKKAAIDAEIRASEITLNAEQRKEVLVRRRALLEAQTAERSARLGLDKAGIGVQQANLRLDAARLTGDPIKVREAELNLRQAQLDYSGAAAELPNSTNAVNQALIDFASSIQEFSVQRKINAEQGFIRRSQFGIEDRDRRLNTQVDAINRGFDIPANENALQRGLRLGREAMLRGLRGDPSLPMVGTPNFGQLLGTDAMRSVGGSATGMEAFTNLLKTGVVGNLVQLVETQRSLVQQLLNLANRPQVVNNNNSRLIQGRPVLAGSKL